METRIQIRRDTAANWNNNNPVLAIGEIGFDVTNNQLRVGDGIKTWGQLSILEAVGAAATTAYDNSVSGLSAVNMQQAIDELARIKGSFFEHEQQQASATWVITHNLGRLPSVTIIDSGDNIVIGDVLYLNNNQVEISFTGSFSGKAYLV
jgi:hypothetical protein